MLITLEEVNVKSIQEVKSLYKDYYSLVTKCKDRNNSMYYVIAISDNLEEALSLYLELDKEMLTNLLIVEGYCHNNKEISDRSSNCKIEIDKIIKNITKFNLNFIYNEQIEA